uniref:KIB1-4 beta-propeller domain-containing protein n=1 Tax=Aegilops tauschii TaxID=37682 RepID=M8C645_AEGTA
MAKILPRLWKDLPADLLFEIARCLSFLVDHNGSTHNLRIGHDVGGARFFGSYDGGWIFLALGKTNRHMLLNLHINQHFLLPDSISMGFVGWYVQNPISMVILSATLSSSPTTNTECFGAAIVDLSFLPHTNPRTQLAIWRMDGANHHHPVAMGFIGNCLDPWSRFEDVIHHKGAFHFLTDTEPVIAYKILNFQEEEVTTQLQCDSHHSLPCGVPGELLMVVRLVTFCPGHVVSLQAGAFQVYRMMQHLNNAGLVVLAWEELPRPFGRMLYVAQGCLRSYEVAGFLGYGFQDGIYFLDDATSNCVEVMVQHPPFRRYTCNDNGRYRWVDVTPPRQDFQRWFPDKEQSNYLSPIWFLP